MPSHTMSCTHSQKIVGKSSSLHSLLSPVAMGVGLWWTYPTQTKLQALQN